MEKNRKKLKTGNEHIHNEFQVQESGSLQCRHCSYISENRHTGKLESHLLHNHADIYADVLKEKQTSQKSLPGPIKNRLLIDMNEDTLKRGCTQLIVESGRPLICVEDPGFRTIIDPILRALPVKLTVSRHTVKDWIKQEALALKEEIRKELKGRYFSIKLDLATRLGRSVFGVNLQFIINGKIHIRTISMQECFDSHTSQNLLLWLERILEAYQIDVSQVYRITGDNGSNVVKTGHLFAEKAANETESEADSDSESDIDSLADDQSEWETDSNVSEYQDLEESDVEESAENSAPGDMNDDEFVDLQWDSASRFKFSGLVRCFEHSLQLSPSDFIKKNKAISNLISRANDACKKLRTPLLMNVIKVRKLKKPQIRNATRWSSTFKMLSRLIEYKSICKEFGKTQKILRLNDAFWKKLDYLIEIFEPIHSLTLNYQKSQMTISEAFANWNIY